MWLGEDYPIFVNNFYGIKLILQAQIVRNIGKFSRSKE